MSVKSEIFLVFARESAAASALDGGAEVAGEGSEGEAGEGWEGKRVSLLG